MWSARSWLTVIVAVALFAAACASGDGDSVSSPDGTPPAPSTQPEPPTDDAPSGEPELPETPADDPPPEETAEPADSQAGGIEDPTDPDDSAQADEPLEPEPDPTALEVLQQEVVSSQGGVVAGGGVEVRVAPGAVGEPVDVEIRAPLGEFGNELGGEVVGIEHAGLLAAPVVVSWDVSALSDEQQQYLLLVRWDEDLGGWVPGDAEYEVSGGVLTAEIQQWSFWTWIANTSQSIQELFGRRIDAPKCSGGALHNWVTEATDTDDDVRAASIRMCYENGPDESIRVRLGNNRVFSQYVRIRGASGLWDAELVDLDLSLPGLAHEAAHYLLTVEGDEATVFLPPLRYVDVVVQRPTRAGPHRIFFRNQVTSATIVSDGVFYLAGLVENFSLAGKESPLLQALFEVMFVCGAPQLVAIVQDVSIKQAIDVAVDVLKSCVPKITDSKSALGRLFRQKIAERTTDAFADQIDAVSSKLSSALRWLELVKAVGYLADLKVEEITGSLRWRIEGSGKVRPLGDWTATCSDAAADSNRLFRHLVFREPFTRSGEVRAEENLHRFEEWEPYAERAVAPLARCDDGHIVAVADDVMTWFGGTETPAAAIVRDLLRAFVPPDPTGGYTAVTAGGTHSCGLHGDGAIACWGNNDHRQLHEPDGTYIAVAAGEAHTCGLRTNQTIACWGLNNDGQTDAPAGRYTAIAAGSSHSCGLRTNQIIACWGNNDYTQSDTRAARSIAVAPGGVHTCRLRTDQTISCWGVENDGRLDAPAGKYTAITAGFAHSCALRTDQTIACWGGNDLRRTDAPGGRYTVVSVGEWHSCAVRTDHTVACWGGLFSPTTDVPEGKYIDVSAGLRHTCGVRTDQTITCWGDNDHGQTEPPSHATTPARIAISAGASHSCAITTGGDATCWGDNDDGQTDAPPGRYTAISAGTSHTCALRPDQTITCWGDNFNGRTDAPPGRYIAISAGTLHSCAITTRGEAVCWGDNQYGQTSPTPGRYTAISAGALHSCAITTRGEAVCWGSDEHGQITDTPSGSFTAISAGSRHSCAITTRGAPICWGWNHYGQADAPSSFTGTFIAATTGDGFSCALWSVGSATCWGRNDLGQTDVPTGEFTAISSGALHTCAIAADQAIQCWGYNKAGRASPPNTISNESLRETRGGPPDGGDVGDVILTVGANAQGLAGCTTVHCRHLTINLPDAPDGVYTIECWSSRDPTEPWYTGTWTWPTSPLWTEGGCWYGTPGDQVWVTINGTQSNTITWPTTTQPPPEPPPEPQPTPPAGAATISAVSAGWLHSCGLRSDGTITCWGWNGYGRAEAPGGVYSAVTAGWDHSCGLRSDGTITCWGDNEYGQAEAPGGVYSEPAVTAL